MRGFVALLVVAAVAHSSPIATAHAAPGPQSVYLELADSLQGSLDDATSALRTAFGADGWKVVAVHEPATDRSACTYRARVLVLDDPAFTRAVVGHGGAALFALPVRVLLFEDEAGLHLATVNPRSIDRTIVAESGFEDAGESMLADLNRIARGALRGRFVTRPYGQVRSRGLIGRTMGVMAGGPFDEKVEIVHSTAGAGAEDVARVADRVARGLAAATKGRWQLRPVYRLDLGANGVVFGVSGAAMETKAYGIVGAGADDRRRGYKCPGLAHAAAFPLEVVVFPRDGKVNVATIDGMYRMKMYFEDAGKMKFAANMGMPGSIEDELRAAILSGVAPAQ